MPFCCLRLLSRGKTEDIERRRDARRKGVIAAESDFLLCGRERNCISFSTNELRAGRPGRNMSSQRNGMHQSSYEKMILFKQKYLSSFIGKEMKILDFGSQDINGAYRPVFEEPGWIYRGVDMVEGKNVDIILHDPYRWREIKSNSYDVFISGQAFEHIEYFWLTMLEAVRVLRERGLCCIIAPSGGPEHRYPVDCYRFYRDGMAALANYAGMESLEAFTDWEPEDRYNDGSEEWKDSLLVARKKHEGFMNKCIRGWHHLALRAFLKSVSG